MFGVKMEYVKIKGKYTVQEFYERIKNEPFEAGVPQLVKYGPAWVIAFPEQDRNNQVQIMGDKKGRFCVLRATTPIGLDKAINNMILEDITGGLSGMSVLGGKKKKICEALVGKTAAHINKMGL